MVLEIPLFPLNVVLFPGAELPLHIFEPRYRQMINECYKQEKPFGVVLVQPESELFQEEPHIVGTMAEIEAHGRRRMDFRWQSFPGCQSGSVAQD